MTPQSTIRVRFNRHWRAYYAGDVAGFDSIEAKRIVALGVAAFVVEPIDVHAEVKPLSEVVEAPLVIGPEIELEPPLPIVEDSKVVTETPKRRGRPRKWGV